LADEDGEFVGVSLFLFNHLVDAVRHGDEIVVVPLRSWGMIWLGQHLSKQSVGLFEVRGGRHPASIFAAFFCLIFFLSLV